MSLYSVGAHAISLTPDLDLALKPAIVSDYRSNGISASSNHEALQFEGTLMHSSGWLAGVWASHVDYDTKTRLEEGGYAGYYHAFTPEISVLGTIGHYIYPKNSTYAVKEFYGLVKAYGFSYSFIYDYQMDGVPNVKYQYLGYTFDLPYESTLLVEYGHHDVGLDLYSASGQTRSYYQTKKLSLAKKAFGIDWTASFIDTDMSKTECLYYQGQDDVCSATMVFGASKSF
ncbi:hypothetical protein AO242_20900 [Pseudomonas sp. ICMP 561]|nr:hypothetical protein AO242_20900 [Pseudomonas sp. ICMP 561]